MTQKSSRSIPDHPHERNTGDIKTQLDHCKENTHDEPVTTISKLHNRLVWAIPKDNNNNRHIELMKFRMIRNMEKVMSSTKGISEFTRCQPIDCDIIDFFNTFGSLNRYIYDKGRRPRGVDRQHIKVLYEHQFKDYFNCEPPSKIIEREDVISKLSFPLIIMYSEIERQAKLDIKYRVFNLTCGYEINVRKIKTSQDASTDIVKALKKLTKAPIENRKSIDQGDHLNCIYTQNLDSEFDWGILPA